MNIGPIEIMLFLALLPVVAATAFAACSETVFFGLRQSERDRLRRERPAAARRVDELMRNPRGFLVTVLFINMTGNTLFFVISSGIILMSNSSLLVEFALAFFSLGVLVVAGETLPKIVGNVARFQLVCWLSAPMQVAHRVVGPIRKFLDVGIVSPLSRLVGVASNGELSMEDVQELVGQHSKTGVLRSEEADALKRVIRMRERHVRDLMTARVFIASIRRNATHGEVFAKVKSSRRNRLIIADPDLDHIQGYLDARSYLLDPRGIDTPVVDHTRKIGFVPEMATVGQLLEWFQNEGERCAVVVDEFGGTAGVVSVRDAIGEISGELSSEWTDEPGITLDAQGWWRIPGDTDLAMAVERLQVALPNSDSTTLGGLCMERLNRVPVANDTLWVNGLELVVESMDRNRVLWLKVRRGPKGVEEFPA